MSSYVLGFWRAGWTKVQWLWGIDKPTLGKQIASIELLTGESRSASASSRVLSSANTICIGSKHSCKSQRNIPSEKGKTMRHRLIQGLVRSIVADPPSIIDFNGLWLSTQCPGGRILVATLFGLQPVWRPWLSARKRDRKGEQAALHIFSTFWKIKVARTLLAFISGAQWWGNLVPAILRLQAYGIKDYCQDFLN